MNNHNGNNDVGLPAALAAAMVICGALGFIYGLYDYGAGGILVHGFPWYMHALFWAGVFGFGGMVVFFVVMVLADLFG